MGSIKWAINQLESTSDNPLEARAKSTGQTIEIQTDLVLKSVGYRSVGITGLPFDDRRGIVRNEAGRVVDETGSQVRTMNRADGLTHTATGSLCLWLARTRSERGDRDDHARCLPDRRSHRARSVHS